MLLSTTGHTQSSSGENFKVVTDREPEYPEGLDALVQHVFKTADYSQESIDARVEGYTMISFTVNADSTVSDMITISDTDPPCSSAVKKVLSSLKFLPALVNGTPLKGQMTVSFYVRAHSR